ncbi:MAG: stage IV sporulation protein A, partial [Intestinibacter sp.]
GIERGNYIEAEERVISELKTIKKPFVVVLNSLVPREEKTEILRKELEEKYEVPILPVNVEQMEESDIENILETVLYDFPLNEIRINISKWVEGLEKDHWVKQSIISTLKQCIVNLEKIRDIDKIVKGFEELEFLKGVTVDSVELGEGVINIELGTKQELFYNVLEEKSGFKIEEDCQLLNLVTSLSKIKQEYDKIEIALNDAKNFGYGVVAPSLSELSLEDPEIIKQGKQYGVKLKANAPSLHIIKADISTEVSPIVGNQNQGEEMVKYLLNEFEQNPSEIWESNMFGKSLNDLVKEQLQSKLYTMPEEIRFKIQKTLQKIINEGSNNIITIIL